MTEGCPATHTSGIKRSLESSQIIIRSSTVPFPPAPNDAFTAAGYEITPLLTGVLLFGETIKPGAPAIRISGIVVSLNDSELAIGSSAIPVPASAPSISGYEVFDRIRDAKRERDSQPSVLGIELSWVSIPVEACR